VPELATENIGKKSEALENLKYDWRLGKLPADFIRFLIVQIVFSLGKASSLFLLLRAKDLGVDPARIPLLWAAVSAVATLFSVPLSSLSDRWGRRSLLVCGYLGFGFCYALMAGINTQGPGLFALFMFYGLCIAATEGAERAVVADLAPANARGAAFGWYYLVTGVTLLPASFGFGALYEHVSPKSAFVASAACIILASALLFSWLKWLPPRQPIAGQLPDRQR
jgi:MFS family permease